MRLSILSLLAAMVFLDVAPVGGCKKHSDEYVQPRQESVIQSADASQQQATTPITSPKDSIQ